jgi:hypothetical protein
MTKKYGSRNSKNKWENVCIKQEMEQDELDEVIEY